jgi:hypothetical protein
LNNDENEYQNWFVEKERRGTRSCGSWARVNIKIVNNHSISLGEFHKLVVLVK